MVFCVLTLKPQGAVFQLCLDLCQFFSGFQQVDRQWPFHLLLYQPPQLPRTAFISGLPSEKGRQLIGKRELNTVILCPPPHRREHLSLFEQTP